MEGSNSTERFVRAPTKMDLDKLKLDLKEHGQEHLLKYWDELDEEQQARFYDDIRSIDLGKTNRSFATTLQEAENHKGEKKDERIKPMPPEQIGSVPRAGSSLKVWEDRGLHEISQGKVAVLLLAGGQGTRLGVSYPKGMYNVGLPSGKTLYQLQAERICRLQELAFQKSGKRCIIPWYCMTSEATKENTEKFFSDHNYFGLEKENFILFEQNTIPCLTFEGKIILDSPGKIARAPDGNGGLYAALSAHKIIEDMKKRGVEYIHVYCVDNILVKLADPVFVGFCAERSAECGAKVCEKNSPTEAVGVVCICDGKYEVVEYSEISLDVAERRDPNGKLTFREGSIANHFFTVNFLERFCRDHEDELPFHIAQKKIPHVDENGERVKPTTPNGIKLEKFVFDVFQFTEKFAVLEVTREDEFSPLKNAGEGKDSPVSARQALLNFHYRQVIDAGGKFQDSNGTILSSTNETNSIVCEVSPLLSYKGEGLEDVVKGKTFMASEEIHLKSPEEEENGEPQTKKIKGD
ncbi:UDP-N-acetylhexosamine pyrophosphorylase isoform X2 [Exaiptasia diaphana]|uniref:UDP-N-acetylglucosamine diphosphorylase n=1 Tax=Exaiptasia diaphana TaxID=2652724 RepID=A0A913XBW4_EXADI|nr:UDP-N-acetylhexosamine pyrophosphorylase isoform X2 [Exaiptasia diaphana]KXJ13545.1 UDP-N-acetylhexosamine pyrophosphorylase [Exaiptasia diaphana]